MAINETTRARLELWRRTAVGVGGVALAFSLVVGVLLVRNWMQAGQAQTVCAEELTRVLAQARLAPDENTVALARERDLAARQAYFTSQAFQHTGVWLLGVGLLIAVACLRLAATWGRTMADPRRFAAVDQARADQAARLAVLAAAVGGLLLLMFWALSRTPPVSPQSLPVVASTNLSDGPTTGVVVAPAPPSATNAVAQWSCFRGPRYGVAVGSSAPTAWNGQTGAGVLWHVALAKTGHSSPVLWGGKLFLTVADEQAREVAAYDTANGNELWRQTVADGGKGEAMPQTSADTGLSAPTAACDELGVYAVFGTGDLVAYSHEGKLRWQVYLHRPANDYGHASSLVVADGKVCVQFDQKEDGRVLAIEAASGKIAWEQKRSQGAAWSSPVVVTGTDAKPVLLVNGAGVLSAYAVASGKELWHAEGVTGEVAPSPAYWNGRIMIAMAAARMVCYALAEKPEQKWEYAGELPDVASPVADQGLIFLAASSGQIACVDATTGAGLWRHDYATGFYASPVICDNCVYALDRDGVMRIFAAERTFREIAACPLGEAADATPAFGNGRIYLRSKSTLWCVGAK